jgi:hypothetical protein
MNETYVYVLTYWLLTGLATFIMFQKNQTFIFETKTTSSAEPDSLSAAFCFLFGGIILPIALPALLGFLIFLGAINELKLDWFINKLRG